MNLTLDIPREWMLTSNQRLNRYDEARRRRELRNYAAWVTRGLRAKPFPVQVHIVAHVSWPTRQRRDEMNLMPTLKPTIDGLVDANLLVDDSTKWLIGPDIRATDELCPRRYGCRIELDIEEAG